MSRSIRSMLRPGLPTGCRRPPGKSSVPMESRRPTWSGPGRWSPWDPRCARSRAPSADLPIPPPPANSAPPPASHFTSVTLVDSPSSISKRFSGLETKPSCHAETRPRAGRGQWCKGESGRSGRHRIRPGRQGADPEEPRSRTDRDVPDGRGLILPAIAAQLAQAEHQVRTPDTGAEESLPALHCHPVGRPSVPGDRQRRQGAGSGRRRDVAGARLADRGIIGDEATGPVIIGGLDPRGLRDRQAMLLEPLGEPGHIHQIRNESVVAGPGDVIHQISPPRRRDEERHGAQVPPRIDRKSTRLNSSHLVISYAVFFLKKKKE